MARLSALNDPQRFAGLLLLAVIVHLLLLLVWDKSLGKLAPIKKTTMHHVVLTLQSGSSATRFPKQTDHLLTPTGLKHPKAPDPYAVNRRTISGAAHEQRDLSYLERWQSYVEHFGNLHYPDVALKNNLRGELRLLVAINKNGTIHDVKIRHSSGIPTLDHAAIHLVYQAGPFEPLPPEISHDTEILEIIRTWQFRGKLTTS